jgi:hypothetical protein
MTLTVAQKIRPPEKKFLIAANPLAPGRRR